MENLNSVVDFITNNKLIEKGDRVGVGVSGGRDSMALMHFLSSIADQMGFEIVAVNVNHNIRPGSRKESQFVSRFCKANDIQYIGFNVDVPTFASSGKMGIEQAARIKRYECFETAIKKCKLTKFALAHHASDQAETILMHIFRGSGLAGARGMEVRRGFYIRPFLDISKVDINAYVYEYQIPYIDDESNLDNTYARNFLRNQIMPELEREWRNIEQNIIGFSRIARADDDFINSLVEPNGLVKGENNIRIALNYFAYSYSIVSRVLLTAFEKINAKENIEKKHLDLIIMLAKNGENGSRVDLPNKLFAIKEYEYITIVRKVEPITQKVYTFKAGKTIFKDFGTITVTKTISYKLALERGLMVIDADKLPRTAKWRIRKDGDMFTKFGGGTKPLAAYLIDKKIPARLRAKIPVLTSGNDILAIAGIEISDKVKTDRETRDAYVLEFIKD